MHTSCQISCQACRQSATGFCVWRLRREKKFQRRPEAKQPSHESGERLAGIGWPAASETPVFQGEKLYLTVLVRGSQDS